METYILDPVTFTLEFYLHFENLYFVGNIWIVSARALIFHKNIFVIRSFCWCITLYQFSEK